MNIYFVQLANDQCYIFLSSWRWTSRTKYIWHLLLKFWIFIWFLLSVFPKFLWLLNLNFCFYNTFFFHCSYNFCTCMNVNTPSLVWVRATIHVAIILLLSIYEGTKIVFTLVGCYKEALNQKPTSTQAPPLKPPDFHTLFQTILIFHDHFPLLNEIAPEERNYEKKDSR